MERQESIKERIARLKQEQERVVNKTGKEDKTQNQETAPEQQDKPLSQAQQMKQQYELLSKSATLREEPKIQVQEDQIRDRKHSIRNVQEQLQQKFNEANKAPFEKEKVQQCDPEEQEVRSHRKSVLEMKQMWEQKAKDIKPENQQFGESKANSNKITEKVAQFQRSVTLKEKSDNATFGSKYQPNPNRLSSNKLQQWEQKPGQETRNEENKQDIKRQTSITTGNVAKIAQNLDTETIQETDKNFNVDKIKLGTKQNIQQGEQEGDQLNQQEEELNQAEQQGQEAQMQGEPQKENQEEIDSEEEEAKQAAEEKKKQQQLINKYKKIPGGSKNIPGAKKSVTVAKPGLQEDIKQNEQNQIKEIEQEEQNQEENPLKQEAQDQKEEQMQTQEKANIENENDPEEDQQKEEQGINQLEEEQNLEVQEKQKSQDEQFEEKHQISLHEIDKPVQQKKRRMTVKKEEDF